jgi:hypothetical protein
MSTEGAKIKRNLCRLGWLLQVLNFLSSETIDGCLLIFLIPPSESGKINTIEEDLTKVYTGSGEYGNSTMMDL